jgi:hypothetical protein
LQPPQSPQPPQPLSQQLDSQQHRRWKSRLIQLSRQQPQLDSQQLVLGADWQHGVGAHSLTVTGTLRQTLRQTVSGTQTATFLHTVHGTCSVTV